MNLDGAKTILPLKLERINKFYKNFINFVYNFIKLPYFVLLNPVLLLSLKFPQPFVDFSNSHLFHPSIICAPLGIEPILRTVTTVDNDMWESKLERWPSFWVIFSRLLSSCPVSHEENDLFYKKNTIIYPDISVPWTWHVN